MRPDASGCVGILNAKNWQLPCGSTTGRLQWWSDQASLWREEQAAEMQRNAEQFGTWESSLRESVEAFTQRPRIPSGARHLEVAQS